MTKLCKVGRFVDEAPKEYKDLVQYVLNKSSYVAVSKAFTEIGFRVSEQVVRRHVLKDCVCYAGINTVKISEKKLAAHV